MIGRANGAPPATTMMHPPRTVATTTPRAAAASTIRRPSPRLSPRPVPLFALFLLLLLGGADAAADDAPQFTGCDIEDYYAALLSSSGGGGGSRTGLHALLRETHRRVLPYTSSTREDVWDGLIDVDGRRSASSDGTANDEVRLIYAAAEYIPSLPHGTSTTWNREHLWPKSAGVGYDGADFTDLHHLRPSDWNGNAARGNKWFGRCGIETSAVGTDEEGEGECRSPAHAEAAADTATDSGTWLPPASFRGDIARALFYMAVRYDGTDADTGGDPELDLVLTDCPRDDDGDVAVNALGYKSQLLEWHAADPVDDGERLRNHRVCARWQGNRNPFVDYPDWVEVHFGRPGTVLDGDGSGGGYAECADGEHGDDVGPSPLGTPEPAPTPAPAPTSDNDGDGDNVVVPGSCNGLQAGDIMITAFGSDNPDVVAFVALADVPPGTDLYVTDNAWTGTSLRSNEGTVKLTVQDGGISSGTVFLYGDGDDAAAQSSSGGGEWQAAGGSFALSASGDSIVVYCVETPGDDHPVFLTALTYSGEWMPPEEDGSDGSVFGTDDSALPEGVAAAHATLPHKDNYWYVGTRTGTRAELLASLSDASVWEGSNTDGIGVADAVGASFVVRTEEGRVSSAAAAAAAGKGATRAAALVGLGFLSSLML